MVKTVQSKYNKYVLKWLLHKLKRNMQVSNDTSIIFITVYTVIKTKNTIC